jgi:hypothetical protein
MSVVEEIFSEVTPLKSLDKLQLIKKILSSLNPSDTNMEHIWAKEAEERIRAYDRGELSTVGAHDVFKKYRR